MSDFPEAYDQAPPLVPVINSDSALAICLKIVFETLYSHAVALDLQWVISDLGHSTLHLEYRPAVPGLGSFRAPAAAKIFPL